tara:strand:+ start:481 stop:945 length:465 start_codon:yes stop_codon:yes gene_type:complete
MKNKIKDVDLLWSGNNGRRRGTVSLYDDSIEVVGVVKIDEDNNTQEEIAQKKTAKKPKKNDNSVKKDKSKKCSTCGAKGLKRLLLGGSGLLKAELGIDAATSDTINDRKAICIACDLYDFGVCDESKGGCGCFCAAKVKLKSEACPLNKWKAVK